MTRKKKRGPGGRAQWQRRQADDAVSSMVKNHRGQIVEPGPAKIEKADRPRRHSGPEEMLAVRNRTQARRDAKKAKVPAKARGRLSQFLRSEDKKRADTAAEVIDPETGKTREEPVEQRVKRRGLSVIKNQIIGGDK